MPSPYLSTELTIINMAKALKPLSDEWLQYGQTRRLAYLSAGVSEPDITRFDREAYRREVMRRKVMGTIAKVEAA